MRRSKAPSMLNKTKRFCDQGSNIHENSDPEDEVSLNWGSRGNTSAANDMGRTTWRIFNVVWRDVTTKKHKTWKGDGTLEVNTCSLKAVLKDELGKYMGCSTRFKLSDLIEEYEMVIGGKEIQIQTEIKNEDEIFVLRKKQVTSRNWGSEEYVSPEQQAEEQKKPKGGFYFRPIAALKPPKDLKSLETFRKQLRNLNPTDKWGTNPSSLCHNNHAEFKKEVSSSSSSTQNKSYKLRNRICFVRPSELQQYLFQQICEYCNENKDNFETDILRALNISNILQQICNHPSFIKHISSTNDLIKYLSSVLPVWSDMGPFDSGKLEFLQYYMQTYSGAKVKGKFIVIAKNTNTINMIHGLCDFMNLKCLRLSENDAADSLKNYLSSATEQEPSKVLLIPNVRNLLICGADNIQKETIIVFENVAETMEALKNRDDLHELNVFYLITAFSLEESYILPSITLEEIINLYSVDFDDTYCYVHTQIECNCNENSGNSSYATHFCNWQHLNAPFDENILKVCKSHRKQSTKCIVEAKTFPYI